MNTTQKISALKAPIVIQGLRRKLNELKKNNRELLQEKARKLKKTDLIFRKNLFNSLKYDLGMHHLEIANEKAKKLSPYSKEKLDETYAQEQRIADKKLKQIRALFDFRKKDQSEEWLKAEAEKIINS